MQLPLQHQNCLFYLRERRFRGSSSIAKVSSDPNRLSFLEILENGKIETPQTPPAAAVAAESVHVEGKNFARGRQIFQQTQEVEDPSISVAHRNIIRTSECISSSNEEPPIEFSSETWRETSRKVFQHGLLGGRPVHYVQNKVGGEIDESSSDEEEEEQLLQNGDDSPDEDLLTRSRRIRRRRPSRHPPRDQPGIYEVDTFPFQPRLTLKQKPFHVNTPKYGRFVERAYHLVRKLTVNERVEEVLDGLGGRMRNKGNILMQALWERGHDAQALSCFQWMRTHEPCLLNEESYVLVFSLLGSEELAQEALGLFNGMPETGEFHSVRSYNELIRTLAQCGRRDEIKFVLERMEEKGVEPNSETFRTLITVAQKDRHSLQEVWSLFQTMKQKNCGMNITVYGDLVKAFCDEGRRTEALAVVAEMERTGRFLSTVIYNTLIDAYAKAGQISEAEGLFQEMQEKGHVPNVSSYNILISGYGKLGRPDVAESLMQQMRYKGLEPDVVTYSALISAYGTRKMSEQAANSFLRMRKDGIQPNAYAYTALIHAYSEGRWHEKAEITFRNMKREGVTPTVETYTTLMNAFKQARQVETVKSIWKEMREAGLGGTRITYNMLLDTLCKHGHFTDARTVVKEYKRLGILPNLMTYNMLINGYARGGDEDSAEKVLVEIEDAGYIPDAYTYSTLIYAFLRVRNFGKALEYHEKMCVTGKFPDRQTYEKLKVLIDEQSQRKVDEVAKSSVAHLDWMLAGKMRQRKEKRFWKTKLM